MSGFVLTGVGLIVAVVVVVLVALFAVWRMMWRVAEPNEALVISGLHQGSPNGVGESLGFKIVTARTEMGGYCPDCQSQLAQESAEKARAGQIG